MLTTDGHIKTLYAFWLPLLLAVVLAVASRVLPRELLSIIYVENGFLEICQPILAFIGVYVGARTLSTPNLPSWLNAWIGIAVLGLLYIGLEEISYGQQLLKWETVGFWAEVNDQNETNFHNTSSWLDQKPRALLLIGIVIGGLLLPLVQKLKPNALPRKFSLIYPSRDLVCVAGLALASQLAKTFYKVTDIVIYDRPSELNEFYMIYFVMFYLLQLRWKIAHPD